MTSFLSMYAPTLARHVRFVLPWKSSDPKASVGLMLVCRSTDHSSSSAESGPGPCPSKPEYGPTCSAISLPQQHLKTEMTWAMSLWECWNFIFSGFPQLLTSELQWHFQSWLVDKELNYFIEIALTKSNIYTMKYFMAEYDYTELRTWHSGKKYVYRGHKLTI